MDEVFIKVNDYDFPQPVTPNGNIKNEVTDLSKFMEPTDKLNKDIELLSGENGELDKLSSIVKDNNYINLFNGFKEQLNGNLETLQKIQSDIIDYLYDKYNELYSENKITEEVLNQALTALKK